MTLAEQLRSAVTQAQDIASQGTTARDRLVQLRGLAEQVFLGLTRYADVALADQFARIEYCKRRGHVPASLIAHAHQFRVTANRVVHAEGYAGTDADVQLGIDLIVAIARFAQVETPDIAVRGGGASVGASDHVLPDGFASAPMVQSSVLAVGTRTSLRTLVVSPAERDSDRAGSVALEVALDLGEEPVMRRLCLTGPWVNAPVWPFVTLWLHDVEVADGNALVADEHTLLVIEPDIAVTARAVSKCYVEGAASIPLHFGKVIEPLTIGSHLTAGNLGAQAFARMLTDEALSNEALLDEATANCLDEVALLDEPEARGAREKIAKQLPVLQETAAFARSGRSQAEAFFIADRLGLQGKPDAVVSHTRGDFVLELKTGKGPFRDVDVPLQAGGTIRLPGRVEHAVQAACYAMILQETEGRAFLPVLLYPIETSKAKQSCRIDVPQVLRVEIMMTRNALVAAEHQLTEGKAPFTAAEVGQPPESSFNKEAYQLARQFARVFEVVQSGSGTERHAWFVRQVQHVYRELWAERLGAIDGERVKPGFSALWTDPDVAGKVRRGEALTAMRLQSDLAALSLNDAALTFEVEPRVLATCEFRDDDLVLLYPQVAGDRAPTCRRLLKARFRGRVATNAALVRLELTDPIDRAFMAAHATWALSRDQSDSSASQLAALWSLASGAPHTVDLLTGELPPREPNPAELPTSASHVEALVASAAAAPDYFLLQGPPGTGKTRGFLPALIRTRLARDARPILAVAFTNRAVDEMRSALAPVARLDPFTDDEESTGEELLVGPRVDQFRTLLAGTQVFVMTVHKAWRRLEWLRSLRPQMVIVDEASQLVDAMVAGLFSLEAPFVMIGDHRQLPPIVVRPRRAQSNGSTPFEEAEPIVSTFERMVDTCIQNGWGYAHGMLVEQHRMHEEIQAFPSTNAYGDRLVCSSERQRRRESPWAGAPGMPDVLTDRRVCFVDVPADPADPARVNRREAVLAAELAARFVRAPFGDHEVPTPIRSGVVGIVAPFRVQCAAIRNELHRLGLADEVHVDTVERYQGSERAVMIVSMTARNQQELARTESLSLDGRVDRKLNVAITRAREHLIVLGDRSVLSQGTKAAEYVAFLELGDQIISATALT
jgi:DNA replication ATP-dependent helicase Dna2